MFDNIEELRTAKIPPCPWRIGNEDCDGDGLFEWEAGAEGQLWKTVSCKYHALTARAFFDALNRAAHWSGEYSQVSGIESTLPAEPPTLRAEQIAEPMRAAVQAMSAIESSKPETRALAVAHVPLSRQQQETIERVTAGLKGKSQLPPGYNPNDPRIVAGTHVFCAVETNGQVCGAVVLRSNKSNEARKHRIPTYKLRFLPEGPLKCEKPEHLAAGCCLTFADEGARNGHYSRANVAPTKPTIERIPFQRPPDVAIATPVEN